MLTRKVITLFATVGLTALLCTMTGAGPQVCTGGSVNHCTAHNGCTLNKDCPDELYCINSAGICGIVLQFFSCRVQYSQYICAGGALCTICAGPTDDGCCFTLRAIACPNGC